jgi:hypothetical protein
MPVNTIAPSGAVLPAARRGRDGDQPEGIRHRVLRHIPETPLESVDAVATERRPGGHRVDIPVTQFRERNAARPEGPGFVDAFGARRDESRCRRDRDRRGAADHRPGGQKDRRHQQHSGDQRIQLQAQLHITQSIGPGFRDNCREEVVGPVVVQPVLRCRRAAGGCRVRDVGIVRRHRVLGDLGSERRMPHEVGREVRAVVTVPLRVPAANLCEGQGGHRKRDHHDGGKCQRRRGRPRGQREDGTSPPRHKPQVSADSSSQAAIKASPAGRCAAIGTTRRTR